MILVYFISAIISKLKIGHELKEARGVKRRLESLGIYESTAQVLSAQSVCYLTTQILVKYDWIELKHQ